MKFARSHHSRGPLPHHPPVIEDMSSWDNPTRGQSPVTMGTGSSNSPRKPHEPLNVPLHEKLRRDATHPVGAMEEYMSTLLDRRDYMFAHQALGSSLLELEVSIAKGCLELVHTNAECAMKLLRSGDWKGAAKLLSQARSLLAHTGSPECVEHEKNEERFVAHMLAEDYSSGNDEDQEGSRTMRDQTSSSNLRRLQSKKYIIPSTTTNNTNTNPSSSSAVKATTGVDVSALFQAATLHRRFEYFYGSSSDDPYGLGRMLRMHPEKLRHLFQSTLTFVDSCNRAYESRVASGAFLLGRTQVERELLPPGLQAASSARHYPRPPAIHDRKREENILIAATPPRPPRSGAAPSTGGTPSTPAVAGGGEEGEDISAIQNVPRLYFPRHRVKAPTTCIVTTIGPEECLFGHGAREAVVVAPQGRRLRTTEAEADSELDEGGAIKALDGFLSPTNSAASAQRHRRSPPSSKKSSPSKKASSTKKQRGNEKGANKVSSPQLESPRTAETAAPNYSLSSPPSLGVSFNHPLPTADEGAPLPKHEASTGTWPSRSPTATASRVSSSSMSPSPIAPAAKQRPTKPSSKKSSSKRGRKSSSMVSQHSEESGDFPVFLGTMATLEAPGAKGRRSKMPPRRRGIQKRKSILLSPNLTEREKRRILLQTTIRIQRWYRRIMWWVTSRDRLVSLRFDRVRARRLLIRCYCGFVARHHLTTSFARDRAILRVQYAFRCWKARKERSIRASLRDRDIRQRERSEGLLGRVVHMMSDNFEAKTSIFQRIQARDEHLEARIAREANDVEDILAAEEFAHYAAHVRIKRMTNAMLSHIAAVDPNLYRAPSPRTQEAERDRRARIASIQHEDEEAMAVERVWAQCIIAKYFRRFQQRAEVQRRKTEEVFRLHLSCLGAVKSEMITELQLEQGRHADTLFTVMRGR
ncbi:Hypothetical protein, putative [Bodo saltans]|uniref:Uncharacterized protein n=1 Tax=Bodo saltans TaxID=75058 RepID=A0A0S4JUM2_BODSA|nr:Hypothetical protein, putative [Bodo saltans]|eukprot:CUG93085.1 Hypothetical protein, putative [Bodo saltans]